ncbi:tannase/feruloyl esterase family alpha/beta hydrolase [Paraburkholderia sp.]|uniref:tannase/feruloyl esterase family alpha/beta hydrolase n=1 Tax=Paraburkholderia sp. TaxID=1926495 RepID=UPI002389B524|nr:tannase/feruloyl esterase family alpha/beta hydrolase [Paraburkholderia sp.]MDE1181929.1 tannase/feruloyl esterase family alpha/beta hydrolase [Paraburkholderia sp.]
MQTHSLRTLLATTAIFCACQSAFAGHDNSAAASACASLDTLSVPAEAIGLPTGGASITSAQWMRADAKSNDDGEFCKVLGAIHPVDRSAPDINFEVNLPTNWNHKALQLGGFGLDGMIVSGLHGYMGASRDLPTPLTQGYVTYGSDSGHQSKGPGLGDASWAANSEAFHNFGGDQIKKTHDVAIALMQKRYGARPAHSYFLGGSQGGHEGFIAVQRFPQDYDGVVSQFPAYDPAMIHLGANALSKAIYANSGAGWISPAKTKTLVNAVYQACDALDGVKDGIISNVAACEKAFTIDTLKSTLRCPGGVDTGNSCLSDAQITTVRKLNSPFKLNFALADGQTTYPRWPILEGATFDFNNFGRSATPSHPPRFGDAFQYQISDTTVRYIFTGDLKLDSIDTFTPDAYQSQIVAASTVLNTSSADISAFKARGGKLLMMHGTVDDSITPYNTINYYDRLVTQFGQHSLDEFVRFYLVPGMGHGSGVFSLQWDPLGALDAWVTESKAPETLIGTDGNRGANRSRPLCVYPAWPRYNGTGDVNAASSFNCTKS